MITFDGIPAAVPPVIYRNGNPNGLCEVAFITRTLTDGTTATMEADPCWPCPWPQDCPPPDGILDDIPQMVQ